MQSQVDEVIDVMQENISKVIERGERLEDLQDKSGETYKLSPKRMWSITRVGVDKSIAQVPGARRIYVRADKQAQ